MNDEQCSSSRAEYWWSEHWRLMMTRVGKNNANSQRHNCSALLGSKWMLLVMCFADMTYLLCCALMDLWFRWKWKRKKFALWLVCVSTSAARICDTSTLGTVTSLWWPCFVLCILFVHCTVYYLHNVHYCLVHLICTVHLRAHGLQSRTGDALWIPDQSQLQQKHRCTIFNSKGSLNSWHCRRSPIISISPLDLQKKQMPSICWQHSFLTSKIRSNSIALKFEQSVAFSEAAWIKSLDWMW